MVTTVHEYDPKTCITAGELRGLGCEFDDTIPDCAWIPRASMKFEWDQSEPYFDKGQIRLRGTFTPSEPFRWIEVSGTIEDDL